jgi:hypothetical protein
MSNSHATHLKISISVRNNLYGARDVRPNASRRTESNASASVMHGEARRNQLARRCQSAPIPETRAQLLRRLRCAIALSGSIYQDHRLSTRPDANVVAFNDNGVRLQADLTWRSDSFASPNIKRTEMPGALYDAAVEKPFFGQRCLPMRAEIVCGIELTVDIVDSDGFATWQSNAFHATGRNVARVAER